MEGTKNWFEKTPQPENPMLREVSTVDEVFRKYADEAKKIYDERTAGDHTWSGLLAAFAFELAAVQ